jgi:hypothetical protein
MIEIAEIFEESRKGNRVVILVRFSGVLEKAIKILEIYRKGIVEKAIQDSGNDNNKNNNDPDDDSEDSESDNNRCRKRRVTSPVLLIGLKGKKAAKVIASKSPAYSCQVSGAGINEFLESKESLQDFFRLIADLETPLPENTRDYYRTHGNPVDR